MSVEAVHEAIAKAAAHCRSGEGPYLLDIKTYRYKGHSMSDPQYYRTKEEVKDYKEKDPIAQVLSAILAEGWLSEKDVAKIEKETQELVAGSVKFAEDSPAPALDELFNDVYSDDYPYIVD